MLRDPTLLRDRSCPGSPAALVLAGAGQRLALAVDDRDSDFDRLNNPADTCDTSGWRWRWDRRSVRGRERLLRHRDHFQLW
ncbi:MAG: hypothetical protein ACRBN8_19335 [Nannocystales bacterium]